jgi:hypothetical protein
VAQTLSTASLVKSYLLLKYADKPTATARQKKKEAAEAKAKQAQQQQQVAAVKQRWAQHDSQHYDSIQLVLAALQQQHCQEMSEYCLPAK